MHPGALPQAGGECRAFGAKQIQSTPPLKTVCFLECFLQSNPNRIRIARCEKSCEGRWLREIFRSRERQFNKGRGDRRFGLRRRGAGAPAFATSMCGTRGGHLAAIRRKN